MTSSGLTKHRHGAFHTWKMLSDICRPQSGCPLRKSCCALRERCFQHPCWLKRVPLVTSASCFPLYELSSGRRICLQGSCSWPMHELSSQPHQLRSCLCSNSRIQQRLKGNGLISPGCQIV